MIWDRSKKVVVSGVGLVTPLGSSCEETWKRLRQGDSGIRSSPCGLVASVPHFPRNGARSKMGDMAIVAAMEALSHGGIDSPVLKKHQVGCAISQSKPVLSEHFEEIPQKEWEDTAGFPEGLSIWNRLSPALLVSSFSGWSAEAVVKRELALSGPSGNVVAACATGVASIELGRFWIQSGMCSLALVGASESSLHPLYRAGFEHLGVLAEGTEPSAARPFDKRRTGFVMGEGSAVLLLEEYENCRRRGHRPLARVESLLMKHSSTDVIRFDPNGLAISQLIRTICGDTIPDYINAHGTGTLFNDQVEARGIRSAFEGKATQPFVSSTKAATGHLLGAAGALEAAVSVLAIRDGVLPPTLNLTDPDPECSLNHVPCQSQSYDVESSLSLSYGFGGQMGAIFFRRETN